MSLSATAVILDRPGHIDVREIELDEPKAEDVVVEIEFSGVSTGTERLLWAGRMPDFPGMGYPLVPGYEAVGRVVQAGSQSGREVGQFVFVPGAKCYGQIRGLFGAAADRIVVPGARIAPIDCGLGERGVLLALAATARHAFANHQPPELIVGHGVLGRLIARLAVAAGGSPTVWERNPERRSGGAGYDVIDPHADDRVDYHVVCDASGSPDVHDALIARLAVGGEVVLAGFYQAAFTFAFPPAFMREARLRIAAEWKPDDLRRVCAFVAEGALSLDGLITHHRPAAEAREAYRVAFEDPDCLKMILDWKGTA